MARPVRRSGQAPAASSREPGFRHPRGTGRLRRGARPPPGAPGWRRSAPGRLGPGGPGADEHVGTTQHQPLAGTGIAPADAPLRRQPHVPDHRVRRWPCPAGRHGTRTVAGPVGVDGFTRGFRRRVLGELLQPAVQPGRPEPAVRGALVLPVDAGGLPGSPVQGNRGHPDALPCGHPGRRALHRPRHLPANGGGSRPVGTRHGRTVGGRRRARRLQVPVPGARRA